MWHNRSLSFLLAGFCAVLPVVSHAAGNPALDALAQGTVVQFSGKEAVSEPFVFSVTVNTADKALNFAQVAGQPLTIAVAPGRTVSGMVESIEQVDHALSQGQYRLRLTPAMNRLKFRSTSRTFYNLNTIQVVTSVLSEAGVQNVELRITAILPTKEMTVQYQEVDFSFVSRLLEEAGIHYHFEPSLVGDKLVLSDGNAGFPVLPAGKLVFATAANPAVVSFARGQSLHSGQVQAGDYNWKTPTADLTAGAQAPIFGDLTERIFPAGVETKVDAQTDANIRLAARVADAQQCRGESTYPHVQAGQRIFIAGHPRADFNQEYVITAVEHQGTVKEYRNVFRCLPVQIVFRPPSVTPQPVVSGVVSGIVVGPAGETKYVDQFGRVRVRFPWRNPAHSNLTDVGDSGFVRVAQIATGVGSTAMWLPDVGDEVVIAFEHGDPNRPVIIGSLYNGKDVPPVALPANKYLSVLRNQGVNGQKTEIVYDATVGNERLVLQSGGQVLTLGANGIVAQGSSIALTAGGAMQLQAGQNFSLLSQRAAQFNIVDDLAIQTGKSLVTQSGTLFRFIAAQTGTIQVGDGLMAIRSDGNMDIVGKDIGVTASGNLAMKSSKDLTLKGSKIIQN